MRSYDIRIRPEYMAELQRDVWSDEPVPASLRYAGKTYPIAIAYRGAYTRKLTKKSYRIECLAESMFGHAKEIHLNSEFQDRSLIRNKLSFDFFHDIGVLAPMSEHVFITMNGFVQGVYLQIESVDEQFLQARGLGRGSIHYAIDDDANFSLLSELHGGVKRTLTTGYELKCGDERSGLYVNEFIYKLNMLSASRYEKEIVNYLDVDSYLRWLAGIVCVQNFDGFTHNYALYRDENKGAFQMIPWDFNATWGRDVHGRIMPHDYVRIQGYNTLTARLLHVASFRKRYREVLEHILEHTFTRNHIQPRVEEMYERIVPYVARDPYMKHRMSAFLQEKEVISQYIENRRAFLLQSMSEL